MRNKAAMILAAAVLAALLLAPAASGAFGLKDQSLSFTNEDGTLATQAGSHPYEMTTTLDFNTVVDPEQGVIPDESIKDVVADLPAGFAVDPNAVPRCSSADFRTVPTSPKTLEPEPLCPLDTVVGFLEVRSGGEQQGDLNPVYNLERPPGVASKLGFRLVGVSAVIEGGVRGEGVRNLYANVSSISQAAYVTGSKLVLWGIPAAEAHDDERGYCLKTNETCGIDLVEKPFITMPRSCEGPLSTIFNIDSWQHPGLWVSGVAQTAGMTGCGKLAFGPSIVAQPTTKAAQSPTGLDFSLDVEDEGITSPTGLASSDIKRAVVTLPEGFSTNPSIAEGLEVCSEGELKAETAFSDPGAGCPNASKVGTVEVQTPLLEESLSGSLFIAKPYENPFNSLIALYMVIKSADLGIVVKQALKVENDPVSGRITTVADDLPQLPFSHFTLHFREGTRSPLASPPGCGEYKTSAVLTPWAGGEPVTTTSAFSIITGPGAGPCPSGAPPFRPGLEAGTLNNAAGRYSPFYLRLSRSDGEQEFTNFSIKLPPGVVGKLAGIPFCPDAAIAAAKARTGPHGADEELASPSCPAASEVGRTLAGAGVGPSLAYAPGKIYLAGPYNGSALSIAAITAVKVGPFDLGTVVIRQALRVNPETAEVFIDPTGSDPIPHIIKGVPVHARDIRAYVERPNFVLNPTSCKRTSTASTVLGSGADFGSAADNTPFTATSPFQAADCASLGFAPKLSLTLKGGTRRGQNPAFKAVLTYPKGNYANIARAQVTLPHSEFLDQAHIKTICTKVQFNQGAFPGQMCPAASIYGYARAITPLLDEPVQGPVFLRSSKNPLPDLVAALHSGRIDVNLVGRIDSVKGGRIRNTFDVVPDAPVTKFTLTMQGGKKGLLVNSTNLCRSTNKAIADFTGQNGKKHVFNPVVKPDCAKKQKKRR